MTTVSLNAQKIVTLEEFFKQLIHELQTQIPLNRIISNTRYQSDRVRERKRERGWKHAIILLLMVKRNLYTSEAIDALKSVRSRKSGRIFQNSRDVRPAPPWKLGCSPFDMVVFADGIMREKFLSTFSVSLRAAVGRKSEREQAFSPLAFDTTPLERKTDRNCSKRICSFF